MKPPSPSLAPSPKLHRGAGEVRIIGGQWRRTKLSVAQQPGLRPTPDRVRETLFNWLGQDLQGWRCIDAFAGTGALGLEAASRGAAEVVLCELEQALVLQLKQHVQRLNATSVQVSRGDGVALLQQHGVARWDLVFLDPPFQANLFDKALQAAAKAVKADGWVYLEAPQSWTDADLTPLGFRVYREMKAGSVYAHLLQPIA